MTQSPKKGVINLLQEFSIPLIVGVAAALLAANLAPHWYHHWFGEAHGDHSDVWQLPFAMFGHPVTIHFLVNDIFMVFFFGIAAKEVTEATLPGGNLSPLKKAINPLFATVGGVVGPVAVFFGGVMLATSMGVYDAADTENMGLVNRGWGIPTATDIALAWLIARAVFGRGHPAINFLLLLAVADDAIGLGIIAVFYGDVANPAQPQWLGLVVAAMAIAYALRKMDVQSWVPYIFIAGPVAWTGLMLAHLHPALALVAVVPFLPGPKRDIGMFTAADEVDKMGADLAEDLHMHHSPLHNFEHSMKAFVDFGLFFFAMANAGVEMAGIGAMTWIILGSLVVGKTLGVTLLGLMAMGLGFPLPARMGVKELAMAGFIAALGLTVALFVAGAAFPMDADLRGQAKMGALMSGFVALAAILIGRMFGFNKPAPEAERTPPAAESKPEDEPMMAQV
ncbi:MAG: NhaA family Na+:H+ antiporter [Chlamydiales bacterium]